MINGIDRVWELYVILTQVYEGEKNARRVLYAAAILTKSSANGSHAIHEAASLIKIRKKKGKSCAENVIYVYTVISGKQYRTIDFVSTSRYRINIIIYFFFFIPKRNYYYSEVFKKLLIILLLYFFF